MRKLFRTVTGIVFFTALLLHCGRAALFGLIDVATGTLLGCLAAPRLTAPFVFATWITLSLEKRL